MLALEEELTSNLQSLKNGLFMGNAQIGKKVSKFSISELLIEQHEKHF
jgi:hypothetical protein